MSAALSRRLARLKMFSPIRDLTATERQALYQAAHAATELDALSTQHRDLIVAAERVREHMRSHQQGEAGIQNSNQSTPQRSGIAR